MMTGGHMQNRHEKQYSTLKEKWKCITFYLYEKRHKEEGAQDQLVWLPALQI